MLQRFQKFSQKLKKSDQTECEKCASMFSLLSRRFGDLCGSPGDLETPTGSPGDPTCVQDGTG